MKSAANEKPLTGWRILTTRASKQSGGLARPLQNMGAEVIEIPTIEIRPPGTYKVLDAAVKDINRYDWLVLTSVNGVEALFARLIRLHKTPAILAHLQIAAIGPATKREIEKHGLRVTVTPEKYIAESVVESLKGKTEGKRVLLVRAKVARDVLPIELRKGGTAVDVVEAYETHVPAGAGTKLNQLFSNHAALPDIVTFTSSSTATNFLDL
ncbi:MAG TPA: uroporphyrinogen-III synthase, partial [Candidatus Sulfotelmatobacter sp.]|nr:uroporphyrinogen-III synthase [Candidatus Sulfotelmatobacter sp.]